MKRNGTEFDAVSYWFLWANGHARHDARSQGEREERGENYENGNDNSDRIGDALGLNRNRGRPRPMGWQWALV